MEEAVLFCIGWDLMILGVGCALHIRVIGEFILNAFCECHFGGTQ
jgi:hypothetical protein